MIDAMLAQKDEMRPMKGFRLVGVDDFEPPGSQLYKIGDYSTRAEAEKALVSHVAKRSPSNTDALYIYEPATP